MGTLTPRDLKVLRNVTGIKENLTPHTQETLAPNEMCVGRVWTSHTSASAETGSVSQRLPAFTQRTPGTSFSISLCSDLWVIRHVLQTDFSVWEEKLGHFAKTCPGLCQYVLMARTWTQKPHLFGGHGETCPSIFPIRHLTELMGVNHSSLWAEQWRRAGRGETWPF